jgi:membrane-bound lytic murein transglycosylase D
MYRARSAFTAVLASVAGLLLGATAAHAQQDLFPRPADLEPQVRFWTRVYTEVDTHSGFIHDDLRMDVVYQTIRVPSDLSSRERRRRIDRSVQTYRDIVAKLGTGARQSLNAEEQRVLALFPEGVSNAELKAAAGRVRFQLGQADRFRAGLIRSGTWKPYIYEALAKQNLPRELAALPHVESSFDPTAYSKVGAAGMWQFMRSTGVRYMRIDHIVDERRDPFLATDGAVLLLAENYSNVETWPLALTAYNHGVAGMRRAIAQQKTNDISTIVKKYQSRSFQFASRNFYTAFLAALEIDSNPEKYFPGVKLNPPSDTGVVVVPDFMSPDTLADALNLREGTLRELNPALADSVWGGDKHVPKGFKLRVPRDIFAVAEELIAAIDPKERFAQQRQDLQHRVRRGDTLSHIAAEYRVSLAALMRVNGLGAKDMIRVGQLINLPVAAQGVTPAPTLLASDEPEAQPPVSSVVPAGAPGTYTVRKGDSIARIAKRLGIDPNALLAANSIQNGNLIIVGQTLRVPGNEDLEPAAVLAANAAEAVAITPAAAVLAPTPAGAASTVIDPEELEAALAPAVPAEGEPEPTEDEAAAAELADEGDVNALATAQVELAADPSDYSVSTANQIQVQALETLGHYADWLELPTQRLRDLNSIKYREAVEIGQMLTLDFSRVDAPTFEQRRVAYQQQRQNEFFAAYQIADVESHVIKPGESLWLLAERTYRVPVWLLRQYNPDLNLDRVNPGTVVKFPRLRAINTQENVASPAPSTAPATQTLAERVN